MSPMSRMSPSSPSTLKSNLHPNMYRIRERFARLYGEASQDILTERLHMMFGRYGLGMGPPHRGQPWSEKDTVLITYGDMVQAPGQAPLAVLKRFADKRLQDAISTIHLLPFYPYSSDDGFSVIDYRQVNPSYGAWSDVRSLSESFDLMFDLVLNHCSKESEWFRDFLNGVAPARDFFHTVDDPDTDLSKVVRPRSLPLLTPFHTQDGEKHVWTTFSDDQVDLNFANPDLLFEFLDILMLYVKYGARIVRLDAIAFLWKKIGTTCLHLPETHEVVKLFRDFLEMVAPEVILLTETNVPHQENISYFGHGDEAQMVYQFPLPPLLLHALLTGNGKYLTEWAASLGDIPDGCTYFNFTASHDGIGVRPLEGLVSDEELDKTVEAVVQRGGRVNTRRLSNGRDKPYELNITYYDALSDPHDNDMATHIARFMCSQTIMVALQGIPGIYFHSLTATPNYVAGVEETGHNRTINRRKWQIGELQENLQRRSGSTSKVFDAYLDLLRRRRACSAFHPSAPQLVLQAGDQIFAIERQTMENGTPVLCLHSLVGDPIEITVKGLSQTAGDTTAWRDLLTDQDVKLTKGKLKLKPYQCRWLTPA